MTEAPDEEYDKRCSPCEEIDKAFKTALQLSFPDISNEDKEDPCILPVLNKELGDYECNNVVTMCLKNPPENMLLKHTAEAIKNNLPPNDMIGDFHIHSVGFLTFRLSTTWMAKSVHRMLNEGIETWAPTLPMKSATVHISSQKIAEEMNVGHLRPAIIGNMLARMLDFSNVHVKLTNNFRNCDQVFSKDSKSRFDEDVEFRDKAHREQLDHEIGDKNCIKTWIQNRCMDLIEEMGYSNFYYYNQDTLNMLRREKGLIEENEGDEVIFVKEKKTMRHNVFERKKKPLTLLKKNGVYDNALADLSVLRHQVKENKAEWIVYVADVGKKDYFEMCFTASRRAKWLPTDETVYPKTKFVGCGLAQIDDLNRSGKLVDIIDDAKTRCKAVLLERVKAGELTVEELEKTAETLACDAVRYALMKDFRVFSYTLNVDEMLNDKGNTSVYLIYTYAQICSIINNSGKEIEELKMTRELTLEKNEERELGLHLLHFTDDLEVTCTSVFPNILCEYLYELSKKFTSFYSIVCQAVGGADEEANKILLCEATRVVMRKCFHLLGITPIDKISILEWNMTIPPPIERDDNDVMKFFSSDEDKEEMVSTITSIEEEKDDIISSSNREEKTPAKRFKSSDVTLVEEQKKMTPPLEPIISSEDSTLEEQMEPNPRFQLFSVRVHVDIYDCDRKPCFLFGSVRVSDMFVSSEENGWVMLCDPDCGYTDLFYSDWSEPLPIINNDYINTLTHSKTQRPIPFTDFLDLHSVLYMFNKDEDILFEISNAYVCIGTSNVTYDKFITQVLGGADGLAELVFCVLSDPVDATLEMTLTTPNADFDVFKKPLSVKIFAYYGDAIVDSSSAYLRKDACYLTLLEDACVSMSDKKIIPLNTSVMAVPANGSLVIDVLIKDANGNVIVKEIFDFCAQRKGCSSGRSEGEGVCIFKLNVNWK